jgi:hypothetical protein
LKAGVPIAYGKSVSVRLNAEAIKDYSMDSVSPALLESGKQSYSWSVDRVYTDETYALLLKAGTLFDIIFSPVGTPLGANYMTLHDCIITGVDHSAGESGAVSERMSGEAKTLTIDS